MSRIWKEAMTKDLEVSPPAAASLATGSTDQLALPGSLPGDREAFALILERHMVAMASELEQLIEYHQQWGDTLQKGYLYKARRALLDGISWFDWARRKKS